MDWLNLHTSILDSPECVRCDPVRRATWIWLLRYCIGQENGGRIEQCASWGDTTWQQMCRVKLKEVKLESPLWRWDSGDLVVMFYPLEKQIEVQSKRLNGARGGRPTKPRDNHVVSSRLESAETEGKGRERKEKGREGEGSEAPPHTDELKDQKAKNREVFIKALRRSGLSATDTAFTEWVDALQGIGYCKSLDDTIDALAFVLERAKADSVNIRYAKDARLYIESYADNKSKVTHVTPPLKLDI